MSKQFMSFLVFSQWASAVVALMYHLRPLLFVSYDAVHAKTSLSKAFYFLTGLGHESFSVFLIVDGILAGVILLEHRIEVLDRKLISQRLRSVYRIVLPGLLLGAGLDIFGSQLFNASGVYTGFPQLGRLNLTYTSLIGNLFMLQPFLVPTFGSNSMLFLLSYLFWYFILLVLFLLAARLPKPYSVCVRALMLISIVSVMPFKFLSWAAIWLLGVAVVILGESLQFKPPLSGACTFFATALVISRLPDDSAGRILYFFEPWIDKYSYFLVALGFSMVAWAMYPNQTHETRRDSLARVLKRVGNRQRQDASFTFFYHFPIAMLLVAASSALLYFPLIQQPSPARYAAFAALVIACLSFTTIVSRIVSAITEMESVKPR